MSTRSRRQGKASGRRRGSLAVESLRFYEQNWPLINYLVPAYGDHGENLTLIGVDGGAVQLEPYRVKTALNRLGRVFSLNLADLRKRCGRIVSRSHTAPLVLTPGLVLLPLRVRSPRFRDDGATGYVVFSKIKQIVPIDEDAGQTDPGHEAGWVGAPGTIPQGNASRLIFQDGTGLVVLQQTSSLDRIFGEAFRVVQGISLIYKNSYVCSKAENAGNAGNAGNASTINPWSDLPGGGFHPGINDAVQFNYPVIYLDESADITEPLPQRIGRTGPRMAMVQVPVMVCRKRID